nr:unnamed protein product [Leishmania braziliensis]
MQIASSFESEDSEALRFLASVSRYSLTIDESENASCTTHITLPHELESRPHMTSTSEIGDATSSSNETSLSARSIAVPECASTRCNTPSVTAGAAVQPLSRVSSLHQCGTNISLLYKLSAEDAALRARIAVNAKVLLNVLTGYEADDIIDLLYVNEAWFSTEVLIYSLCLVNRLTFRYPSWCATHAETDCEEISGMEPHVRCSFSSSVQTSHLTLPHVCSSTSSDTSHADNYDEVPMGDSLLPSKERVLSASTNSLGDVFNRHNTRRRIVALLLISGKFHGDVVYKTSSLANVLNKFRDEQRAVATLASSPATVSVKSVPSRLLPRITPDHLGQCEKRLFQELSYTILVSRDEYQHCEDIVLQGI